MSDEEKLPPVLIPRPDGTGNGVLSGGDAAVLRSILGSSEAECDDCGDSGRLNGAYCSCSAGMELRAD